VTGLVRPMGVDDVARVQEVEVDAGERFREVPEPRVAACADHPPFPSDELRAFADEGRAWVVEAGGTIVGFVLAEEVDGWGHIEELAVVRSHGGRGIGTALIDAVAQWAIAEGLAALTLTTFRDVPWNRPFYERRGFRVLNHDEITDGLRAKVLEEAQYGLPPELRVVMRRPTS
jgi:GNAT superfamily N-acetyltransferase